MGRLYPKQPLVGVGAVVVCSGNILLEKRENEPGRGKWSIPGGIVELGEEAKQTAVREVREETNLTVEKPELIDVVDNVRALKASSDAAELRWVRLDDVENYALTETFREFFIKNYERLKNFDSCKRHSNHNN